MDTYFYAFLQQCNAKIFQKQMKENILKGHAKIQRITLFEDILRINTNQENNQIIDQDFALIYLLLLLIEKILILQENRQVEWRVKNKAITIILYLQYQQQQQNACQVDFVQSFSKFQFLNTPKNSALYIASTKITYKPYYYYCYYVKNLVSFLQIKTYQKQLKYIINESYFYSNKSLVYCRKNSFSPSFFLLLIQIIQKNNLIFFTYFQNTFCQTKNISINLQSNKQKIKLLNCKLQIHTKTNKHNHQKETQKIQ
ncbi:hypothetical protein TTHERM_000760271 (macronuclear) [Tetrahymena thermophila SB210]|uniref:Uncharacterized protein n=1 Tax=Tetrahymena thermophila (strain SB210) TaxID=312017 RepID=W7X276_TETTS|nr:hypothetical protein TTHERM_000760271 [Tetrahymena thermophila SB210]EWS71737.1 hypothetical protein TTHERM_000760271 [Tetrahymena thermophila SB210]|eukprot:XP_012655723.1 hypothetical protein TTHERM_000760271 [Tetrahymena thermophila SB210]